MGRVNGADAPTIRLDVISLDYQRLARGSGLQGGAWLSISGSVVWDASGMREGGGGGCRWVRERESATVRRHIWRSTEDNHAHSGAIFILFYFAIVGPIATRWDLAWVLLAGDPRRSRL